MIRNAGHTRIYPGQNIPFERVQTAMLQLKPTHLLTFSTSGLNIEEHPVKLSTLAQKQGKPKKPADCVSEPGKQHKHIALLPTPSDLLKHV
jgi:hypothetical protein